MTAQKLLIIFGLVLVAIGILWPLISKLGLGRCRALTLQADMGASSQTATGGW